MIRQGDIMVVPVTELPARARPVEPESGRVVLAHGEVTGHHHSIALSPRVAMFRATEGDGGLYLTVTGAEPVALEHQEHTALPIPPGQYRVVRQRVWEAGMARRVQD